MILLFLQQSVIFAESIYKLSYGTDISLASIAVTSLLGSQYLSKKQHVLSQSDLASFSASDVNAFDRSAVHNYSNKSAQWSDFCVTAIKVTPAALFLYKEPRTDAFILFVMYLEAININNGITGIVKPLVSRKRPFVYNPDIPDSSKLTKNAVSSFYSGHTSLAFTTAVFTGKVFSDYYPQSKLRYAFWGGPLLIAACTGYLRYNAGVHFPSDILAGAAAGSLVGYIVPWLHKINTEKLAIMPYLAPDSTGFMIRYSF